MQNISTNILCVGYLLRIYISMNIPQYSFIAQMYGSEHSARRRGRFIAPVFQPNQMVLMCRNDANCNAIWWNYVGAVWGIAMPTVENCNAILWVFVGTVWCIAISTMGICNAILWVFVDTGTINRSPTAADRLPFCGCLRICKYQKNVLTRTLVTRYNTTTYTKCLLWQCKNHTFAM